MSISRTSLSFYGGNKDAPYQVIISTLKSTNNILELLHNTSIFYFKAQIANPNIQNILKILVDEGHTVKAGRLAGAFRSIGYIDYADEIIKTMKSFGYNIKEENPFNDVYKLSYSPNESPYCSRLKLTWETNNA